MEHACVEYVLTLTGPVEDTTSEWTQPAPIDARAPSPLTSDFRMIANTCDIVDGDAPESLFSQSPPTQELFIGPKRGSAQSGPPSTMPCARAQLEIEEKEASLRLLARSRAVEPKEKRRYQCKHAPPPCWHHVRVVAARGGGTCPHAQILGENKTPRNKNATKASDARAKRRSLEN